MYELIIPFNFPGVQGNMADGQRGNVSKDLKIKVTSNAHVIILQTLLSCLKSPMMNRLEITHYCVSCRKTFVHSFGFISISLRVMCYGIIKLN